MMLNHSHPQVELQAVPDEIALALSISGCNLKCKGCHSPFTWDNNYGSPLTEEILKGLISKYKHITCVLFYGGEWNEKELIKLFKVVKRYELKLCLYTGLEKISDSIIHYLDYLKVGAYKEELGGLEKKTTNQQLFRVRNKDSLELIPMYR